MEEERKTGVSDKRASADGAESKAGAAGGAVMPGKQQRDRADPQAENEKRICGGMAGTAQK